MNSKISTDSSLTRLLSRCCAIAALATLAPVALGHERHDAEPKAGEPSTDSLFHFQSEWKDQDNQPFQLKELKGNVAVVSMVYTTCQAACPLTISDMQQIQDGLSPSTKKNTKFLVFSIDPKRDTPEKLKDTAKKHKLDMQSWKLLSSDEDSIRALAAALGVKYKPIEGGEFSHSNIISVVDRNGVVQHQHVGLKKDPKLSIQMVNSLAEHAAAKQSSVKKRAQ